ncbi:MAG: lysylphosphatidylglycerol synthase domain-containing protein [Actinomycetota bacterium]
MGHRPTGIAGTPAAALLQRTLGRRPTRWSLGAAGAVVMAVALVGVYAAVDRAALTEAWRTAIGDPGGIGIVVTALLAAFALRAAVWRKVLPGLTTGQALAAIHLSMGANHVLPFRLGEPLRVASVVRRAPVDAVSATASAVVLRLADVATLVVIGAAAAPVAFSRLLGTWGWLMTAAVAIATTAACAWVRRLANRDESVRMPGLVALAGTGAAWLLEAVAVWQALRWAGIDVTPRGALLVTAAAVSAQVVAVAPSGFGTYEAAAVAALASLGHDPGVALAAALTAHACKTAYSLVAGGVAIVAPRPSLLTMRASQASVGFSPP